MSVWRLREVRRQEYLGRVTPSPWRESPGNATHWGKILGTISPVCAVAGLDPEHEDIDLLLGDILLGHPGWRSVRPLYQPRRTRVRGQALWANSWPTCAARAVPQLYPELVAPAVIVLAAAREGWWRLPSALRDACEAAASVCLASGFCAPAEPLS